MAIQTVPQMYAPSPPSSVSAAPTFAGGTIGAGQYQAFIFQAPVTGTVTGVGFSTGAVTTGCTLDVRMETVTAGLASGSLVAANTNITQVVADGDDNVWFDVTFTAGANLTAGTIYALAFRISSGTPVALTIQAFQDTAQYLPYMDNNGAAALAGSGTFVLNYNGTYHPILGIWPITTIVTDTFNNASTPNTIGLKFTLPVPARIIGFWAWLDLDASTAVKLYDKDGVTVLASTSALTSNTPPVTSAGVSNTFFGSSVVLQKNTAYYLAVVPSSGSSLTLYSFNVNSAAQLAAAPAGANFMYTSASTPSGTGSWTDVNTRAPFLGPIFDGFDDGAPPAFLLNPILNP